MDTQESSKFEQARLNPTSIYDHPMELVRDAALSRRQKLDILRAWDAEATHLQESAAEGFDGGEHSLLSDIKKAELWLSENP